MYDNECNEESDDSSMLFPSFLLTNVQRKSQLGKRNKKVFLSSNPNIENNNCTTDVKEKSTGLRWLRETPSKNIFEENNHINTHRIDYFKERPNHLMLNNERSQNNIGIKKLFNNEENVTNEIFDKNTNHSLYNTNENEDKYVQSTIQKRLTPLNQECILDISQENNINSHDENQNQQITQNQESDDSSSSSLFQPFPILVDEKKRKSRLGRRKVTSESTIDTTNNTEVTDPKEKSTGLKWLRETPHKDVLRDSQEDIQTTENNAFQLSQEKIKPQVNFNLLPLKPRIQINNDERIASHTPSNTSIKIKNDNPPVEMRLIPWNNCPNKENQNPIECQKPNLLQKEVEFEKPRPVLANKPASNGLIKVKEKSYQVLCLLGKGGSSKVYQVLSPENNKILAIKKVDLTGVDKSIADGYLNEVKVLADLQGCEQVIKMFGSELVNKNGKKLLYVVMEKGDTDLSRLIKSMNKDKKISPGMIFYYWTEMLNAVHEIHKSGIIHMDLKPANFLLVNGRLKLIDFGIASSIQEDMTSVYKDTATGTYNYMSPEALKATSCSSGSASYKVTYRSDVWSLGCILYSLIYGRTPYQHITNTWAKLTAIADHNDSIEFPPTDLPTILIDTLKACLKKDPKQRLSVEELLNIPYYNSGGSVIHSSEIVLQRFTDRVLSLVRNDQQLTKAIADLCTKECEELKSK